MYDFVGIIGVGLTVAGIASMVFKKRNGVESGLGLLISGLILIGASSWLWGPQ